MANPPLATRTSESQKGRIISACGQACGGPLRASQHPCLMTPRRGSCSDRRAGSPSRETRLAQEYEQCRRRLGGADSTSPPPAQNTTHNPNLSMRTAFHFRSRLRTERFQRPSLVRLPVGCCSTPSPTLERNGCCGRLSVGLPVQRDAAARLACDIRLHTRCMLQFR